MSRTERQLYDDEQGIDRIQGISPQLRVFGLGAGSGSAPGHSCSRVDAELQLKHPGFVVPAHP